MSAVVIDFRDKEDLVSGEINYNTYLISDYIKEVNHQEKIVLDVFEEAQKIRYSGLLDLADSALKQTIKALSSIETRFSVCEDIPVVVSCESDDLNYENILNSDHFSLIGVRAMFFTEKKVLELPVDDFNKLSVELLNCLYKAKHITTQYEEYMKGLVHRDFEQVKRLAS